MKSEKGNGKKGWMMIVEAVIAVMILFGFVFAAIAKQAQEARALQTKQDFYDIASFLALQTLKNETMRNLFAANDIAEILRSEAQKINPRLNVSVAFIDIKNHCISNLKEKEIYAASVIIAVEPYELKKICVFVWQENV